VDDEFRLLTESAGLRKKKKRNRNMQGKAAHTIMESTHGDQQSRRKNLRKEGTNLEEKTRVWEQRQSPSRERMCVTNGGERQNGKQRTKSGGQSKKSTQRCTTRMADSKLGLINRRSSSGKERQGVPPARG